MGNIYDAVAKATPADEQESMDDLAASFLKKSNVVNVQPPSVEVESEKK